MFVRSLDDPPEISCNALARIACIREYVAESYKNGVILQVQKNLASFLKESCKETSDLLKRQILQQKGTKQKSLAIIFQDLAFLALFARFLQFFFCKNNALSCKILQETSKNLESFVWKINQGFSDFSARYLWDLQFLAQRNGIMVAKFFQPGVLTDTSELFRPSKQWHQNRPYDLLWGRILCIPEDNESENKMKDNLATTGWFFSERYEI